MQFVCVELDLLRNIRLDSYRHAQKQQSIPTLTCSIIMLLIVTWHTRCAPGKGRRPEVIALSGIENKLSKHMCWETIDFVIFFTKLQ